MISGTIAGSSSFTVYPLGEITILRPSYSYYYISYTPSSAAGTMWIRSTSTATPVSYQLSSYSGMLNFGNSYPQYLSFESCTWSGIETNIPSFYTSRPFLAFFGCRSLSQVSLPMCRYIGSYVFGGCMSLSQISLPLCSYIGDRAFADCSSLSQVSLPMCSYIGMEVFYYCISLSQISLPMCSYIGVLAFQNCESLSQVSLSVCSFIDRNAFQNCYSLSTITIGYSGVCSLSLNAFNNTQITKSTGRIYVPASLVSVYKKTGEWRPYSAIIQSYPGL